MLLYDRNIIGPSSEIVGNLRKMSEKCSETFAVPSEKFWKIFGNLRKVVGNLRKIVKSVVINMFIAPQGFGPDGHAQNPRRHTRSPRVYRGKFRCTRKNLDF